MCSFYIGFFFFFKQKTAYEMRISDWSSDVCSSDLVELDLLEDAQDGIAGNDMKMHIGIDHHQHEIVDALIGDEAAEHSLNRRDQIGRASCRERVCQYV